MCIRMCCGPCRASWPLWLSSAIAGRHPPCSAVTLIGKDAAHDVVIRATRPEASVEGKASGKGWCCVERQASVQGWTAFEGWRCVKGQASVQRWTAVEGKAAVQGWTAVEGWTRVAAQGWRQTRAVGGASSRPSSRAAHPG